MQLKNRIKNVKYLFISLYGVLGKNKVLQNEKNKIFLSNIQDGMGVTLGLMSGLKIVVVGNNFYPSSKRRAKELKTTEQISTKKSFEQYINFITMNSINEDEIAWIASDLDVLSFFKKAKLRITIPEAPDEIKKIANFVTKKSGGNGALREIIETIIKHQGKWKSVIEVYYD
ncbi:MAG: hypothetical protein HY934_06460 [Candidatus Firestonebacteria bacterium]|nr:hypothetical protein [Candidatus Firestonebacteria bacterium]